MLIAGNSGSVADAEHIVGELMKAFVLSRKLDAEYCEKLVAVDADMGKVLADNLQGAVPTIALDDHLVLATAYMNNCELLLCTAGK